MRSKNGIKVKISVIVTFLVLTISVTALAGENEDLAKETQNPIGNIISLPFENNFDFGVGPEDAFVDTLNKKPVYPLNLGKVTVYRRVHPVDVAPTIAAFLGISPPGAAQGSVLKEIIK